jgi:cytochrome b pre-mRNA-processing protein 3
MLTWLTGRKDIRRVAQRLYDGIVAQSRLPVFYIGHGVPDTVTGRFEMIVLHMFLVLERLQAETGESGERAGQISQALTEAFIGDMDSAMREMGVADVRVGKRMHQAAGAFFGRLMAYRKAIELAPAVAGQTDPLAAAIARNVLAEAAPVGGGPELSPSDVSSSDVSSSDVSSSDVSPGDLSPSAVLNQTQAVIDLAAVNLAAYMRAATALLGDAPLPPLEAGEIVWPALDDGGKGAQAQ